MSVDLTVGANGTGQQPSDDEVIDFAREAIEASREESRRGRDGVLSTDLQQPGVTVDLGHRNIVRLPDEVIDIIKQEIERCVNFLSPTITSHAASVQVSMRFVILLGIFHPYVSRDVSQCEVIDSR